MTSTHQHAPHIGAPDLDLLYAPHVLREYAVLADGERGAVIGPHGDIVWLCAPRWESDAVLSSLIGGGGVYAVTPTDPRHVWGGHYEPGSLIWRSRWITSVGAVECREALAFPGDPDRVVLLRRIVAGEKPVTVRVLFAPAAGFGAHPSRDPRRSDAGVWSGRTGPLYWRWHGAGSAGVSRGAGDRTGGGGHVLCCELTVPVGGHHDLVLELSEKPLPGHDRHTGHHTADRDMAEDAWAATEAGWAAAMPSLNHSLAPRDAAHAYAVLRGLTAREGGMVAAATMSLPERASAGRSYDYRYAWVRDQCYAGMAAAAAGGTELLDRAVGFVTARLLADGPLMRPAYTVSGGRVPDEHRLNLPGYPGGTDVRGNWVNGQCQLDAYGELLMLLATAARADRLDADGWRALHVAAEVIGERWSEPDAGIWELHDARWTHSRLACVAGLRGVAGLDGPRSALAGYAGLADAILARTSADSVHPEGHWQRRPGDPGVDAALLLPPVRGALPGTDPRTVATLDKVRAQLCEQGYVYRFRHDDRPLGKAEGAFLLCGFMLALAQRQQGDAVGAARTFERTRAACGPPGLFSEEYDVTQRQMRGNLPQAFVHALMLETAVRLVDDARPAP